MKQTKRIMTILAGIFLFSFCIFNDLWAVQADASPPPGAIGSDLFPNENATKVRMEAETVLITIPADSPSYYGHSVVTATFYMRNLGSETEEMTVRFPMNNNEFDFLSELNSGSEYCHESEFPSIQNFSVMIDGKETDFSTTTKTIQDWWSTDEKPTYTTYNCWAHFDVVFPPGEQVIIQVEYQVGGFKWDPHLVSYKYILQTGKGWNDTIGSADIVVKLPYEIDQPLLDDVRPGNYVVDGQTVQWHFEDFEPEDNIEIQMVDPSIWSRVVRETANVEKDPDDGEAWGRLAKAYKEVITERHGFLLTHDYPQYFVNSIEAYQKAIALLPNDIDWHWGYAEIICEVALNNYIFDKGETGNYEKACVNELITISQLNPDYEKLVHFLEIWKNYETDFYTQHHLANIADLPLYTDATINPNKIFDTLPTSTATNIYTPTIRSTNTPMNTPVPFLTHTPWPTNTSVIINIPTNTGTPTQDPFAAWRSDFPLDNGTRNKNQLWFSAISTVLLSIVVILVINLKKSE